MFPSAKLFPTEREPHWPNRFILTGLQIAALYAAVNLFIHPPSLKVIVTAVVLFLIGGFGIAMGYHRGFTHNGFACGPVMRGILLVAGGLAIEGQAEHWVLTHRSHHRYADVPGRDPHSPLEYPGWRGLAWAHFGWMMYHQPPLTPSRDLTRDPLIQLQKRYYWVIIAASFGIPLAIGGWNGLLVAGVLRVVWMQHITWSVNSVCHKWGSRAKDSRGQEFLGDDSRNNLAVAALGFGEGLHSNHHADPACAYHGWGTWSVDPTKWLLIVLERLRLVTRVRKPKRDLVFKPSQLTPAGIREIQRAA